MTAPSSDPACAYAEYLEKIIVVDVAAPLMYIGRLVAADEYFLTLTEVDVHDLSGTNTTKEVYALEVKRNGVQACRESVKIKQAKVLSFSLLDEVIIY